MNARRRKRPEWHWWIFLATFFLLLGLTRSFGWSAGITIGLAVALLTPAHKSGQGHRIGHRKSPVYIPEWRLNGDGKPPEREE